MVVCSIHCSLKCVDLFQGLAGDKGGREQETKGGWKKKAGNKSWVASHPIPEHKQLQTHKGSG